MPFNDIYLVEVISNLNGVFCRNTFHFKVTFPAGNAQWLTEYFHANFFEPLQHLSGFDLQYLAIRSTLISQPLADNYIMELDQEFGKHPATCIDPRLSISWSIKGDHAPSKNSSGRLFLPGVPADWAQQPPKVVGNGIDAHTQVSENLQVFFGKNGVNPFLHWGVFSKRNHAEHPDDEIFFWFPVTKVYVRALLSSLRTRRLRPPF
jgi:hypothetical protein